MYMKPLLTLLLFLVSYSAFTQSADFKKPDYKAIEKNIKDKRSPYFFNTLFERYTRVDTTMTIEEKRHLYYGYSFTDAYSPYATSDTKKELNNLLNKKELTKAEKETILRLTAASLKQYPFSIRMKEYRMYFLKDLGFKEELVKESAQTDIIVEALLSSGDGRTKESSFYVINISNEYELINVLGFQFGGEQSLVDFSYDYLTLADNSYKIKGFYFEISRSMDSLKN